MKREWGITLLELLVTLAIVAILLAAGVPAFRSYALNLEMRSATTRLMSDLNYARYAAVDRSGRVTVCPGDARLGCRGIPEWSDGWIIFGDDNGDRNWQPGEELLRVSPLLRGISARSSAGRRQLSFFPNGSAPGSNQTIWLCDQRGPAHGRQVRISLPGRIRTTRTGPRGATGC